jgi:hypothetical protein
MTTSPFPKGHTTASNLQITEACLLDVAGLLAKYNAMEHAQRCTEMLAEVRRVSVLPSGDPERTRIIGEAMDFQSEMRAMLAKVKRR